MDPDRSPGRLLLIALRIIGALVLLWWVVYAAFGQATYSESDLFDAALLMHSHTNNYRCDVQHSERSASYAGESLDCGRALNEPWPLAWHPALSEAAAFHARWLLAHQDCNWQHECPGEPKPAARIAAAGYEAKGWAENIAVTWGHALNARFLTDNLIESDGHRANMLVRWTRDIGVACDQEGRVIVCVQVFALGQGQAIARGARQPDDFGTHPGLDFGHLAS